MKLKLLSLGLAGLFVANGAMAEDFNASVTVQNTLTIENTTELNFGTIYAAQGAADDEIAKLVMATDGSTTIDTTAANSNAAIRSLEAGEPAEFSITGAGNFTPVTLTFGNATLSNGEPDAATFTVDEFTGTVTAGLTVGNTFSGSDGDTASISASSSGELSFTLGASLITEAVIATNDYRDGALYEGSYSIDVSF